MGEQEDRAPAGDSGEPDPIWRVGSVPRAQSQYPNVRPQLKPIDVKTLRFEVTVGQAAPLTIEVPEARCL